VIDAKDKEIQDLKNSIQQITDYNEKVIQMIKEDARNNLIANV
jgi:hypothetical protein